jgi:hypothetical protein
MEIGPRINMLCLLSGANWNNNANAGVWAANWNNNRTNSNNTVGFRLDYGSPQSAAMRIVEPQGCAVLHNGEIFLPRLFGRLCRRPAGIFNS